MTNRSLKTLTVALCAAIIGIGVYLFFWRPDSAAKNQQEAIERSQAIIERFMDQSNVPGLSISVGYKGKIIWSQGFGHASVNTKETVDPSFSKFRIGSVSKPITAFAVGLLVQEGKLDLDAPVQAYVPGFPLKRWPISVRQVAGHLSGIRHYEDFEKEIFITDHYNSVTDSLSIFKDDPLLHEPGTKYSYSSYGWNLISAVIEGASGEEFLSFMEAHVFQPLDMGQTMPDDPRSVIDGRVAFYDMNDGKPITSPHTNNSYKWASGGFLSTTEDLIRFAFAHIEPNLLGKETIELLWTPMETRDGQPTHYCIGWHGGVNSRGVRIVGHRGGSVGGTTAFTLYPDHSLSFAIAINASEADTDAFVGKVQRLFIQALVKNQ